MKRIGILCLLFCLAAGLYAQDVRDKEAAGGDSASKAAIGIGPEWNMNSRDNFAMGGVFEVDFNL